MRSTEVLTKLTLASIHPARSSSHARARPSTALRATAPLLERLSQQTTAKRSCGGRPACGKAQHQPAQRRRRVSASGQQRKVRDNVRRRPVEMPVGAKPVCGFGDGQGHDGGGAGRKKRREPLQVRPVPGLHNAADDGEVVAAVGAFDDGVEPVLRGEGQCGVGAAAGEGGDTPVRGVAGVVGEPGLVRAVEGAQPEVDDPDGCRSGWPQPAIEFRKLQSGGLLGLQFDAHSLNTFRGDPSTMSMISSWARSSLTRCSATSRARKDASIRREASWRAGIEQNARVSSMKPDEREKPAVSVTAERKRSMASGASRNHHGAPR